MRGVSSALVGADVERETDRPWVALEVDGWGLRRGARVDAGRARREVQVAAGTWIADTLLVVMKGRQAAGKQVHVHVRRFRFDP